MRPAGTFFIIQLSNSRVDSWTFFICLKKGNNVYALYCTMEMPVVDSYWQNCYNFLIDSGRIISI